MIYIEAQGKTISELMTAISSTARLAETRIVAGKLAEPVLRYGDDGKRKVVWDLVDGAFFCGVPVVDPSAPRAISVMASSW